MSTFTDNFSATNGTNLDGYNGWVKRSGDPNTASIVSNQATVSTGGAALFISPATPGSANVNISATLVVPASPAGMVAGVVGQVDSTGQYCYALLHNTFSNVIQLYAFAPGGTTLLASYSVTLSAGNNTLELDLRTNQQVGKLNGVAVINTTDSSVAASTHTGITFNNTNSTGFDTISSFTTADGPVAIAPNDSRLAAAYSPLHWRVTSTSAVATVLGSEMNFSFTGTSCAVGLDLSKWTGPSGGYPVLSVSIDNGPQTQTQLTAGQTSLTLATGLSSGTHGVRLTYIIASNTSGMSRWTDDGSGGGPAGSVRITSISVDTGATVSSSQLYPNLLLILGDSISECDFSAPGSILTGDPRTDYCYRLGEAINYTTSRIVYAGTGYTATSSDNIPPVGTHWKNFDSIHARPVAGVASSIRLVVIIHGVNDLTAGSSTVQSAAQSLYSDLLTQLPNATILVYIPFGQAMASAITAAVAAVGNSRVKLRNLGSAYSAGLTNSGSATYQSLDGTHPNTMTHAQLRGAMLADIQGALGSIPASRFPGSVMGGL